MNTSLDKVLCAECRSLQEYYIQTVQETREWNGKNYVYNKRIAYCKKCNQPIMVPGLIDLNETEFENKCRKDNEYILVEDIYAIIEKYNIDKRPLSNVLGLGEHTIEKYLKGQLPNKSYSNMLKRVLASYTYMQELYDLNKSKLNQRTAKRLEERLSYYRVINSHDTLIETIALYILNSKYEITNMALQKLLYYVDAFGQLILGEQIFNDRCEAWTYGPVYPDIYEKYKSFRSEPIEVEKVDFSSVLTLEIQNVINYVLENFAIYNGIALKDLTHAEKPWIDAHAGYGEKEKCEEEITHQSITEYFEGVSKKYDLTNCKGVRRYIASLGVL